MKMSKALFDDLKRDCEAVCAHYDQTCAGIMTGADAWWVFHQVSFDRSCDDTHPAFARAEDPRTRVLPCNRAPGEPFIDRFYRDEDLNDTHIVTALRRIFPNAKFNR